MIEKRSIFFWHLVLLEITKEKNKNTTNDFLCFFLPFFLPCLKTVGLGLWIIAWHSKRKRNKTLNQRAYELEWSLSLCRAFPGFWGRIMEGGTLKVAKNEKAVAWQPSTLCYVWVVRSSGEQGRQAPPSQSLVTQAPAILAALAGPGKPRARMLNGFLPTVLAGGQSSVPHCHLYPWAPRSPTVCMVLLLQARLCLKAIILDHKASWAKTILDGQASETPESPQTFAKLLQTP